MILAPRQWTIIAHREADHYRWRWRQGWEKSVLDDRNIVTMHQHAGSDIYLVAQPVTQAWRRVLTWAARK